MSTSLPTSRHRSVTILAATTDLDRMLGLTVLFCGHAVLRNRSDANNQFRFVTSLSRSGPKPPLSCECSTIRYDPSGPSLSRTCRRNRLRIVRRIRDFYFPRTEPGVKKRKNVEGQQRGSE